MAAWAGAVVATAPEPAPPVAPWQDLPITGYLPYDAYTGGTIPPIRTAPCEASDLRIEKGENNGAGGRGMTGFTFVNVSDHICSLYGHPDAVALAAGVEIAKVHYGTLYPDPPTAVDTPPGGRFVAVIETSNWCNRSAVDPPPLMSDQLLFRFRGGEIAVDARFDTRCGVGTTAFGSYGPRQPGTPYQPMHYLSVAMDAPRTARAGEPLPFVVTLTNPTERPLTLDPCPGYRILLVAGKADLEERFERTLACNPGEAIPPGGSARYEIRAPVPDGFTGVMTMWWQPIPLGADASSAVLVY